MTLIAHHRVPRDDIAFGLVRVEGLETGPAPARLASELDRWVAKRRDAPLSAEEEATRKASRDILRNGKYKPTGRGKPASEYLLRTAGEPEGFPRINGPVDANNLISIQHCLAASVWDLDLAGSDALELRLGAPGESYVFNATGQTLALESLVCGCALRREDSTPIITPIKDSLATKLRPESTRVGGCVYYPLGAGSEEALRAISEAFCDWLITLGPQATGAAAVCGPGGSVEL